jgi:hypothetical protein
MADVLDKISDNIAGAYAAKAGGTAADWRGTMRAETWYLPDEAVAAGLADEAIPAATAEPAADDAMHAQWDPAVYGYNGPPKRAAPKPGPPKAKAQDEPAVPTLVISIADLLDEDAVARLRAAVAVPADASAGTPGTDSAEAPAAGAEPPPPVAPAPAVPVAEPDAQTESEDDWDAIVANLTKPADDWSSAFTHLTQTPASSATDA